MTREQALNLAAALHEIGISNEHLVDPIHIALLEQFGMISPKGGEHEITAKGDRVFRIFHTGEPEDVIVDFRQYFTARRAAIASKSARV